MVDKNKLMEYLEKIYNREMGGYFGRKCGCPSIQPNFSPNVVAEIMNKVASGEFD